MRPSRSLRCCSPRRRFSAGLRGHRRAAGCRRRGVDLRCLATGCGSPGEVTIGARSEHRVRVQLQPLAREGWRIRHSLRWHGGGDVDHVAIAPQSVGLAFAIETKTRTYRPHDLARVMPSASRWPSAARAGAAAARCPFSASPGPVASSDGRPAWQSSRLIASFRSCRGWPGPLPSRDSCDDRGPRQEVSTCTGPSIC